MGGNAGSGSGVVAGGVRASPSREPYLTLSPMVAVVEAQLGEAAGPCVARPSSRANPGFSEWLKWMVQKRFNPLKTTARHVLD